MTTLDLDTLVLDANSHDPGSDRMCVMEAVAMLAGEQWSDHPQCASPVIGAFLRSWNDSLPDDDRQQLKQYIPRLLNSRGTHDQETERSWLATDWLVRVQAPAWLRLAGLTEQADLLASMQPVNPTTCPTILPALKAVRTDAAAAWAAAWDAAARWSQAGGDGAPAGGASVVVVARALDWQLHYFRNNAWTHPLSSGAESGSATHVLPDGVRLFLTLAPGQALAGPLVLDWVRPDFGGGS